jgi:ATP-dependent exoDNAse (exonuclease V) beta subunit
MEFIGIETDQAITTRGFISRTNSALIAKMVELNRDRTPYGLVRKASEIFKLPLMIASMKYQGYLTDPNYKYLQAYYDDWYEDASIRATYKTALGYLSAMTEDDFQLAQAIRLLLKHGTKLLFETYREAANHESGNHNLTLMTCHSSKGLEMDEIIVDASMNDMLTKEFEAIHTGVTTTSARSYKDAVNLYYVCCSRAKKSLINANHLDTTNRLV